ncbi:transglutaminase-like domain-containing protein [Bifidobacterium biavatii]|uniref:Transglutaminase n=1 Tax=Bifidobacterium biavatii DSM 23969 TaxID=1437608 RepID=A0A087A039_9BIFI|nr:transglutaminase-like domain-containing protein [Bifidobacterium biavatii]KFI52139.1 transglutaminase [Bifidobacterium biavatii DSM 23969]
MTISFPPSNGARHRRARNSARSQGGKRRSFSIVRRGSPRPVTEPAPFMPASASASPRTVVAGAGWSALPVAGVMVLLAASNLIDVYGSAMLWAFAALPSTGIGLLAAWGASASWGVWRTIALLASAQGLSGPLLSLLDRTDAGAGMSGSGGLPAVVSWVATACSGWTDAVASFKYLIAVEPPIGASYACLSAVWTICMWGSFLVAICLAGTDAGSRLMLTVGWTLDMTVFVLCALLGTSNGVHRTAAGVLAAIVPLTWCSYRRHELDSGRLLTAMSMLVAAGLLAAAGGCALSPAQRLVLRNRYDPPPEAYGQTSPLNGMRGLLKDHHDDVLLAVTGLPAGTPVRLAVMDAFDGNVWHLSGTSDGAPASSRYRLIGDGIASSDDVTVCTDGEKDGNGVMNAAAGNIVGETTTTGCVPFSAVFAVEQELRDHWLPLAGTARTVNVVAGVSSDDSAASGSSSDDNGTAGSGSGANVYYNGESRSALLSGTLSAGLVYEETGVTDPNIDNETLARAFADDMRQTAVLDVPDSLSAWANATAAGHDTDGAVVMALANALRSNGWFSDGLADDYPSPSGHGHYRLSMLFGGDIMVGNSEQYASAMALAVRGLGMPSRVVLGFLPKDESGAISEGRTVRQADGSTVTRFTGADAAAWVEVKFRDLGWVAVYPTPPETRIPDDSAGAAPPDPLTLVRQPPPPLTDPLRDEMRNRGTSTVSGQDAEDPSNPQSQGLSVGRIVMLVAGYGSPLWILTVVCGAILTGKSAMLWRLRHRGPPNRRIVAGWSSLLTLARQSGVDLTGTRRAQARSAARRFGIDEMLLRSLCDTADYAEYSGGPVSAAQAESYWRALMPVRQSLLASLPCAKRLKTRLSLARRRAPHQSDQTHRQRRTSRLRIARPGHSPHVGLPMSAFRSLRFR